MLGAADAAFQLTLSSRKLSFASSAIASSNRRLAQPMSLSESISGDMESKCAVIELAAEDPIRVAQVLKKAWMEGGIKRGLVGSVLVEADDGKVQIVCQGKQSRLKSFAEWIESYSRLVKATSMIEAEQCPVVPLSNKFPLADAEVFSGAKPGSFAGDLAEQLKSASTEANSRSGKQHSSDEGKF